MRAARAVRGGTTAAPAPVLVEDLLDDPHLGLTLRVDGDVSRAVRWVHVIEVPRPDRFLRGGEVVLTAGVWRSSGVAATDFVADLAAADVAALGFGLVPPETEPPEELLDAAAQHGLVCFVVPVTVPFVQIIEAFVTAKRSEWERPLRAHLDQHDAMVSALRSGRGVEPVLRVLSRRLGLPMAMRAGGMVRGELPDSEHAVPLIGEGDAVLVLPRPPDELTVEQQAAVSSAMPFLGLELERERAVRATELRYAWELFDWVRGGTTSAETIGSRLGALGVPTGGSLAALVVRTDDEAGDATRLAALLGGRAVVAARDGVAAVVALTADPAELGEHLVAGLGPTARLGIGTAGPVENLRVSLLQAGQAADTLVARGNNGWLCFHELSSPTLLLSGQDPELLNATARAVLGTVVDSDDQRGTELLPTLAAFLDRGCRWKEAAEDLHVHLNTLRHRMRRVEELTGLSLSSTPDRVDLFLALKALRAR